MPIDISFLNCDKCTKEICAGGNIPVECVICCLFQSSLPPFIAYIEQIEPIQNRFDKNFDQASTPSRSRDLNPYAQSISRPRDLNPYAQSIPDESHRNDADAADFKDLLRVVRDMTNGVNLPSRHKEIALEQIDLLLNLPLETDRADISKKVEVALLVLKGISSS